MSSIHLRALPGVRWCGDRSVRRKVLTPTAAAAVVAATVGVIGLNAPSDSAAATSGRMSYEHHHRVVSLIVLTVGPAIAAGIGWALATVLTRGIRSVRHVAEGLATGELTRRTGLTGGDELGQMSIALDTATRSLRGVMAEVVASSDAVTSSSEELSASAADANTTVMALGESSREVDSVVALITTIAEQTNLLALNATIEAATGSGEIATTITGVSGAAESATLAQSQTTVAVDELSRMAAGLRSSVGRLSY